MRTHHGFFFFFNYFFAVCGSVRYRISWLSVQHMLTYYHIASQTLDITSKRDAVRERSLCYQCRHLGNWTKQHVVFDSGPFALLCDHINSSTKPEVYNALHCCQRRTEPWRHVTCTEHLGEIWTCGFWDIRAFRQTDKQTDRHADHNTLRPYRGEVIELSRSRI